MSKWIRKGDKAKVIAGNHKGKVGEVLSRDEKSIILQDVNLRKKHMRPTQESQGGRIVEKEMPIAISNVCICDKDGNPLKLRVQVRDGKKSLVYGAKGKETVYRAVK